MSGMFGSQEPTGPTPAQLRADELAAAENERSERGRIDSIQRQLRQETTSRSRGFGLSSLFGALSSGRKSLLGSG
jgi:hypothetical protein